MRMLELKQERNFFMLIVIMGVLLNFIVMSSNDDLMPVKSDYVYEDNKHFTYLENSEIKHPMLSDWIGFQTDKFILKASPGDVLIILGVVLLIINCIQILRE